MPLFSAVYNLLEFQMVRDGILYGAGFFTAAALLGWLLNPWWAIPPALLGCFLLWFFRDPKRKIPPEPGVIVSPADGKVTDISLCKVNGEPRIRVSIFLNVFDVHVNRSPIGGVIKKVEYKKGKFLNAMGAACAEENEQNIVTVEGEGQTVVFKQIAGLLARRIVFNKRIGDALSRGERIGMIKFGSRADVLLAPEAEIAVEVGNRVKGGSSILGRFPAVVGARLSGPRSGKGAQAKDWRE
ncbi:MAG: phosphatidylserine decarboxylase [Acidobacteriales bacterium]|nr:phosphatidylserine decarboxylase [Terriglobales bacterium]